MVTGICHCLDNYKPICKLNLSFRNISGDITAKKKSKGSDLRMTLDNKFADLFMNEHCS